MATPKRYKYASVHRLSYEGKAKGCKKVDFGSLGLVAQEGDYITERQIEAARIAMTRYMKRGGKVWIRIFPQLSRTKKPTEVRMGSGKGSIDHWAAVVKAGTVMFEVEYPNKEMAKEALRLAMHKLPIKCKIIEKVEVAKKYQKSNVKKSVDTNDSGYESDSSEQLVVQHLGENNEN